MPDFSSHVPPHRLVATHTGLPTITRLWHADHYFFGLSLSLVKTQDLGSSLPLSPPNSLFSSSSSSFFYFVFLGSYLWHMEVPRLGVELELRLLATATATAMQDPSCVCDLHHSSRQGQILNVLIEARGIEPAS